MSLHSAIEWLFDPYLELAGATWNRWIGCTRISSACSNCYLPRQPPLRMRHLRFDKVAIGGKTPIVMMPDRVLYKPLTYRRPLLIFPNSLADLWHPAVPIERTAEMFAVMLLATRHIFQTTTKRHRRQRNWLRSARFHALVSAALERIAVASPVRIPAANLDAARAHLAATGPDEPMAPLPNVWIGVTCEANENGERLRYLAQTPAAVTWASCEPITDPHLDLIAHLTGPAGQYLRPPDWVVFGGESGPAAKATNLDTEPAPGLRPLDPTHLETLIGQARQLGAAVFVKQLGEPWARQTGAVSRAGRDMAEWPAPLRVREYPAPLAERALRFDPDNPRALAALAATTFVPPIPGLDNPPAVPAGR
jgi:protein gp37